jgi:DUF1680 family protein
MGEYFGEAKKLNQRLSDANAETCNSYNMLKLTDHLFQWSPSTAYGDYTERVQLNHIMTSENLETAGVTYFVPLRMGSRKNYSSPFDDFTCCRGTGMENHVKYRDSIYFHDADALVVNLFVPSQLHWRDKGVTLTQATRFPEEATTSLRLAMKRPATFTLRLRHPGWSRTATVRVNGVSTLQSAQPGRYLDLERTWRDGDVVELSLTMEPALSQAPAAPDILAFTYGPLVLAGALGREGLAPGADIIVNERKYGEYNAAPIAVPQLSGTPDSVLARLKPGAAPLEFTLPAADGTPLRLIPYHRIAHERYATYWKLAPVA